MSTKEIDYEGWLVKSPPTKRIWRARWRRRWFTLKQGEIPGQFCLEYYTDQNCRKLKGVIDLDQCEQVDSGLHLVQRKQNFQYMFDIKTPRRTYYLAADTEADMICWVNCICQVCNLHDFTKPSNPERPYYNVLHGNGPFSEISPSASKNSNENSNKAEISLNETTTTSLNNSSSIIQQTNNSSTKHALNNSMQSDSVNLINKAEQLSINNAYQNNDFPYVNTEYTNRETVVFDSLMIDYIKEQAANTSNLTQQNKVKLSKSMIIPMTENRSSEYNNLASNLVSNGIVSYHTRSASDHQITTPTNSRTVISSSGVIKKIPENLVLNTSFVESNVEPSPALSTSSGPYIPISECFSGSPKFLNDSNNYNNGNNNENPTTPLNSLDPKFYETPRSRIDIGLNLTNDKSYSPKITNVSHIAGRLESSQYSPTDSESGFTDEDDWAHVANTKPSDSSAENDSLIFTYAQRFSKVPDGENNASDEHKKVQIILRDRLEKNSKRKNLVLRSKNEDEKISKDFPQLSDTENTSPAIGPIVGVSSHPMKESSNSLQYCNLNQFKDSQISPENPIATSTPNLLAGLVGASGVLNGQSQTMPRNTKIQADVFTFPEKPPVFRDRKPKGVHEDKATVDSTPKPPHIFKPVSVSESSSVIPPSINRNLKPTSKLSCDTPKLPLSRNSIGNSNSIANDVKEVQSRTLPRTSMGVFSTNINSCPIYNNSNNHFFINRNSTTVPANIQNAVSTTNTSVGNPMQHQLEYTSLDFETTPKPLNVRKNSIGNSSIKSGSIDVKASPVPQSSGVIYSLVDRVKTDAVKQMFEDIQKSRRKD